MQHTAAYCNALAATATHCHTLQPGFIVMKEAFSGLRGISVPSKTKRSSLLIIACLEKEKKREEKERKREK